MKLAPPNLSAAESRRNSGVTDGVVVWSQPHAERASFWTRRRPVTVTHPDAVAAAEASAEVAQSLNLCGAILEKMRSDRLPARHPSRHPDDL